MHTEGVAGPGAPGHPGKVSETLALERPPRRPPCRLLQPTFQDPEIKVNPYLQTQILGWCPSFTWWAAPLA